MRQSFKNNAGTVAPLQSADFDMLGLELNKTAIPQSNFYKYQKQERVEDFGLDIDVFKYRISDSKIGRFWSTDPASAEYPHNSVYAFQENNFVYGGVFSSGCTRTSNSFGLDRKGETKRNGKIYNFYYKFFLINWLDRFSGKFAYYWTTRKKLSA